MSPYKRHCDDPRWDAIYAWPKQGEHELTCVYLTVRCTYYLAQVQSCALQTHHDTVCAMFPCTWMHTYGSVAQTQAIKIFGHCMQISMKHGSGHRKKRFVC
jgi:hypothetical protein